MRLARLFLLALAPGFAACFVEVAPPPPPPPAPVATSAPATLPMATASAAPTTAPTSAPDADAGVADATISDAQASDAAPPETDSGVPDKLRACLVDSDCVAVDRVGCCKTGHKEAVASSQATAYARSFKCPEARPICAMHLVVDPRVAECDNATRLCTMVEPEQIPCGGFIKNAHKCAAGYNCLRGSNPDGAGTCVRATSGGH